MAEKPMTYDIRDISLAPYGHTKIDWVKNNMPLLSGFEEEFRKTRPLERVKISLSIHLEPKTAYLCKVLAAGGAKVCATGSNNLSTQDDTCAALVEDGISVFAYHGATEEEYRRHIEMCLEQKPNIIIDDGGDLVGMVHGSRPDLAEDCWGGCEETTTGILRLRAMQKEGILKFPMLAVNDADCKHLFDNRYGTGQSVWTSIMANTNLIVAGKTVVVIGYGWCGRGIAMRAAAMGADVIVCEVNPVKAMEARMDGYSIMPMAKAAHLGDVFVSATGCKHTITVEHMLTMKNRAILANAGHFNVEVDMAGLEAASVSKKETRKNIMGYELPNGRMVNVIGEGKLVNIAAGDGHPAEIMDLSFAVQILSALHIVKHHIDSVEATGVKNVKCETAKAAIGKQGTEKRDCAEAAAKCDDRKREAGNAGVAKCDDANVTAIGAGGKSDLPNEVIDVSSEIDELVARRKLAAWGLEIDHLTPDQEAYLSSWQ